MAEQTFSSWIYYSKPQQVVRIKVHVCLNTSAIIYCILFRHWVLNRKLVQLELLLNWKENVDKMCMQKVTKLIFKNQNIQHLNLGIQNISLVYYQVCYHSSSTL